jgi:hypothetical protein
MKHKAPSRRPGVPMESDSMAILPNIPGYVVLMITRYGMPRRKVYLDLGHARPAVQRAEAKGQPARLILCELQPVAPDLDLDGEVGS